MDMTEPRKFENEVRPLRLSEAIRIGARMRPQCEGRMFSRGASCALGAAYEAIFGWPGNDESDIADMSAQWFMRLAEVVAMPDNAVRVIGMDRNDSGWTREQIADWLEAQGL